MAIGIGIGIPFIRVSEKKYPTQNLQGRYLQINEGEDLVNAIGGISIPYISGTGLDQIFDFSVLNDARFNKSNATYWGSSLNSWFYYDAGNPYHAKMKDFHYRYLINQMLVDDVIFAKLSYTSTTLISVDEILVYSSPQTTTNLVMLKTYIGILPDYYGDSLLKNGSFSVDSNWVKGVGWTISGGKANRVGPQASAISLTQQNAITSAMYNKVFLLKFDAIVTSGGVDGRFGFKTSDYKTTSGSYSFEISSSTSPDFLFQGNTDFAGSVDNAELRYLYINYYNNEVSSSNPIQKPI